MKEIEELISNSDKYKNITIQKKFDSKKNTVTYVTIDDKPRVLKWFRPFLVGERPSIWQAATSVHSQ